MATGMTEARPGSGYYVLARPQARPQPVRSEIDMVWLTQHMLDSGSAKGPGLGVLPATWLDGPHLGDAMRPMGREGSGRWVATCSSHVGPAAGRGAAASPRRVLGIAVAADQIVLTTGITHGLDLVLRTWPNPATRCWWPTPAGSARWACSAFGARAVGVPCTPGGLDLDAMEQLARDLHPKLMILGATAHNPTGLSADPASERDRCRHRAAARR